MTGNYSSQAVKEELLEALRSDILRMTPTTLRTETALFSVVLSTGSYDRNIPVYSSFLATMSVLEKYHITVPQPLMAEEIDSIVVYVNDSTLYEKYGSSAEAFPSDEYLKSQYKDGSTITITDKAEITRLLPMLIMVDDEQQNLGLLETANDLNFSVYATDAAGGWVRNFMLRPEFASEVTVGMALSPAACAA
ncbi:hypothetical protein SDC9_91314 [bioreactor metagenome]|uniref:Uncharacterized protein n=1 Tax=bioreactor metagenome TaxID=1076179 RepID=A0A644ZUR6_9ZZZZ